MCISCNMNLSTFYATNHADCDVEISNGRENHTIKKNESVSFDGDYSSVWNVKSSALPCKVNQASKKIDIYNNFSITKLNVKNTTAQTVTFTISNNPIDKDFSVNANDNIIIDMKVDSPTITNSTNNFYTLNKIDGEWYLTFI